MKQLFVFILIFFIASFQYSCKKESIGYTTTADQVTIQLKKVIADQYIERVYPVKYNDVFPDTFPFNGGTSWSFSNGFIEINYGFNLSYSLLYLRYYAILQVGLDNGASTKALILYF